MTARDTVPNCFRLGYAHLTAEEYDRSGSILRVAEVIYWPIVKSSGRPAVYYSVEPEPEGDEIERAAERVIESRSHAGISELG